MNVDSDLARWVITSADENSRGQQRRDEIPEPSGALPDIDRDGSSTKSPRRDSGISIYSGDKNVSHIPPAKRDDDKYHRKHFQEPSKEMSIGNDCGLPGESAHLSLAQSRVLQSNQQPRTLDALSGRFKSFPLSLPLGAFRFFSKTPIFRSSLEEYGLGLVFYFKLVKALAVIFLIMSVVTLPSLVVLLTTHAQTGPSVTYNFVVNKQSLLGKTTIASLGDPIPICRDVVDGDIFKLSCPMNTRIQSFIAYYGQPQGHCGCPYDQQLIDGGDGAQVCPGDKVDGVCETDSSGTTIPCNKGSTRFGESCCSTSTSPRSGEADLSSLEISPTTSCDSYTAPYIATALCTGKKLCTFDVGSNSTISFPIASLDADETGLKYPADTGDICERTTTGDDGTVTCHTSFAYRGVFSGCNDSAVYYSSFSSTTASKRLLFEAVCAADSVQVGTREFSPQTVIRTVSNLDAVATIIFVAAIFWLIKEQEAEVKEVDRSKCGAADYTVVCTGIQPERFENLEQLRADLKQHFESQLKKQKQRRSTIRSFDVESIIFTEEEEFEVADINFVMQSHDYLHAARCRGWAAQQVDEIVDKIRSKLVREKFFSNTYPSTLRTLKVAMFLFEYFNRRCHKLERAALKRGYSAYITFETERACQRCLFKYSNLGPIFTRFVEDDYLKLGCKETLIIDKSPDPLEIHWENLTYPLWKRFVRFVLTTAVTVGILTISYAIIYRAKAFRADFTERAHSVPCDAYDVLISRDTSEMAQASAGTITYQMVQWDKNPSYYGLEGTDYGSFNYLKCYCRKLMDKKHSPYADKTRMDTYTFEDVSTGREEHWCDDLTNGSYTMAAATFASAFVIVIVNELLARCLRTFVKFERWASQTAEVISFTFKLFIAQYINTAMLLLIVNGDLSRAGGRDVNFSGVKGWITFGIFTGNIPDYNSEWYLTVGGSLLFTVCMITVGIQPLEFLIFICKKLQRAWDRRWSFSSRITHQDTQTELNRMYSGPEFRIEEKYAGLLTIIFVDMTYSAAMPLFYIITTANLVIFYCADKFLMLRYYRKPKPVDHTLPRMVTKALYFCAFIHVCQGLWMFGNRIYSDPAGSIETTTTYESRVPDNQASSLSFPVRSHSWAAAINWRKRIANADSYFLLILFCFLLGYIVITTFRDVLMIHLGGAKLLTYMKKRLRDRDGLFSKLILRVIGEVNEEAGKKGNPPYFEAIAPRVLLERLRTGMLSADVERRYAERCLNMGLDPLRASEYVDDNVELSDLLKLPFEHVSPDATTKFYNDIVPDGIPLSGGGSVPGRTQRISDKSNNQAQYRSGSGLVGKKSFSLGTKSVNTMRASQSFLANNRSLHVHEEGGQIWVSGGGGAEAAAEYEEESTDGSRDDGKDDYEYRRTYKMEEEQGFEQRANVGTSFSVSKKRIEEGGGDVDPEKGNTKSMVTRKMSSADIVPDARGDSCCGTRCLIDALKMYVLPPPSAAGDNTEGGPQMRREMLGHESYNMFTNEEYCREFGFYSQHMCRARPLDFIGRKANLPPLPLEKTDELQRQIDLIISQCTPQKDSDGNVKVLGFVYHLVASFFCRRL